MRELHRIFFRRVVTEMGKLASMTTEDIVADLLRLETLLLNPAACSRPETLWPLFVTEFVEIGCTGRRYDKEQALASLRAANTPRGELSDFQVVLLADNVAHVTYRAVRLSDPPIHSLRSSIWRRRGLRWQIVFHQGTHTVDP
jgi:hypothetical protein